jgi:hypothetical protein
VRYLPGEILGSARPCEILLAALSHASVAGGPVNHMARKLGAAKDDDPWWTAQLLKLGEDALAFERIEQMPTRGKPLVQRAHDLVSSLRNGDPFVRAELEIVLGILSDRQDQPKPKKQASGSRKPMLSAALKEADKAGKSVRSATLAPDGTASIAFGEPEPTEARNNPWLDDLKVTKQ